MNVYIQIHIAKICSTIVMSVENENESAEVKDGWRDGELPVIGNRRRRTDQRRKSDRGESTRSRMMLKLAFSDLSRNSE